MITGHEAPDKTETSISYKNLVGQNGTIVNAMGVIWIRDIVKNLLANGLSPDIPAACIEQGTTEEQ